MSRISCLNPKLATKAQALISEDISESEAIAQVLNEEYTEIISQLNELNPQEGLPQDIITIPKQEAITFPEESQEETQYEGQVYDFARVTNKEDADISEILSEFLTAYVDIAKDPYILEINAVTDVANTVLMMVRQGIPLKTVFYFVNQPVIKDYLKEKSINNSVSNRGSRAKKPNIIKEVLKKYNKTDVNPSNFIYAVEEAIEDGRKTIHARKQDIYSEFTLTELRKGLKGEMTPNENMKVLDVFLEMERQSGKLQEMMKSSDPDTRGFKTFSMLESQVNSYNQVKNSGQFINYEKLFDGFIGSFYDVKENFMNNTGKYFLSQIPQYKIHIDSIKKMIMDSTNDVEAQEKMFRKVENDFFIYLLEKSNNLSQDKLLAKYFKGPNSIPRKFKRLQDLAAQEGEVNELLESVVPEIFPEGERGDNLDSLKPIQKKVKNIEEEAIIADSIKLRDPQQREMINEALNMPEGDDFFDMMDKFVISQTGTDYSPYNLVRLMPSEDYTRIVKGALEQAQEEVEVEDNKGNTIRVPKLDITDFVKGVAPGVGSYVLNNMRDFFKSTRNLPFDVYFEEEAGKFFVSFWKNGLPVNIYERGSVNFKDYRTIAVQEKKPTPTRKNYFQLSSTDVTDINPNLNSVLTKYLQDLGIDVKYVSQIKDVEGNTINAYGQAKLAERTIELVEGKINEDTLPEEAAHMITAMLGKNHPIIRQMMAQIPSYKVYNEVKSEYADVYNTEDEFRFEAVGKLISQHIVRKASLPQQQRTEVTSWWNRLLTVLKRFLSGFTFSNVKREIDIFEQMAGDILSQKYTAQEISNPGTFFQSSLLEDIGASYNMNVQGFMDSQINPDQVTNSLNRAGLTDIGVKKSVSGSYFFTRNGKKINPFKRSYYQLKSKSQEEILNTINEVSVTIAEEKFTDSAGNQWYIDSLTGQAIEDRVTAKVTRENFEKNKTKAQLEEIRNRPNSIFTRKYGIEMHTYYEGVVDYLLTNRYDNLTGNEDKARTSLPESNLEERWQGEIARGAERLLNHISDRQNQIDDTKKAKVLTEQVIRGKIDGKDTAGTIDVMVIYSDGRVSLYDYKFMSFKKELQGKTRVIKKDEIIDWYKKRSFDSQIGHYKRILKQHGVTKFDDTRVLPHNLELGYDFVKKQVTDKIKKVESFNMEQRYLMPIPLQEELTGNKSLDEILSVLFEQSKALDVLARKNYADKNKLYQINAQQNSLSKVVQDIQIKGDVSGLVDTMENILANEESIIESAEGMGSLAELYQMFNKVKALISIQNFITESITDKTIRDQAFKAFGQLGGANNRLWDKIKQILAEENPDIENPQRELSWWSSLTDHLSKISQPAFEIARKYIKTAWGNINRDVEVIVKEAEVQRNKLDAWAKSKGISLLESYRKIINPETGNLVYTFSSEFYDRRKQAWENEEFRWLREQYEITEEGKRRYKENLNGYVKALKLQGVKGVAFDRDILRWRASNDLTMDSAWLNKWSLRSYATIKNPNKWYSDSYKDLLKPGNEALKEYFDWYVDTNKKFNTLVPERIGRSFVANIQRDAVDTLVQGGKFSPKEGFKEVIDSLRVRQNDVMGVEEGDVIPLIYYDNFLYKTKEGNWEVDLAKKNEDLTYNMVKFAGSVYKKHHMNNITDIMDALKLHLSEQKVIKTDMFGNPEKRDNKIVTKESGTNLKTFDAIIKGIVYGQKLQGSDIPYEINGKLYSGTKTIKHIMSFLSAKALGFNYVSAFGNLVGGHANIFIKATGGRFFTKKQLSNSWGMLVNRKKDNNLFHHLAEHFNVEKERWIQRDAAKLSASAITRNLNYDKIYLLQQKGDEMVGNIVLMSMLQNYGLDNNGKVKRLAQLPEGSKSLMERVVRKDDKISVEGMDETSFDDFRGRVMYQARQIKGTNTQEDISAMQTTLAGQVLLQFRSWLAPMVSERYGSLKYTREVEEWEVGRYNSLLKTLTKERFFPNMIKIMTDIVTLGAMKFGGNKQLLNEQYNKFIENNPDIDISVGEYIELRERTIREAMVEARMIAGFVILLMFAKADWDDDGTANFKETFSTRQAYKLMNRAYLELSFFSNPSSFNELIKDPIPVISVGTDIVGFGLNTFDEVFDTIATPFGWDDADDKKNKLHYLGKNVVGVRFMQQLWDDYADTALKE